MNNNLPHLTAKEEEIMSCLWALEKAFVKEIAAHLDQNLHYNTVSTIVRNLEEKGFVEHQAFGKTHQYYPKISKEVYSEHVLNQNSKRFFNGSYKDMVSFFAKKEQISKEDLEDILKLINK